MSRFQSADQQAGPLGVPPGLHSSASGKPKPAESCPRSPSGQPVQAQQRRCHRWQQIVDDQSTEGPPLKRNRAGSPPVVPYSIVVTTPHTRGRAAVPACAIGHKPTATTVARAGCQTMKSPAIRCQRSGRAWSPFTDLALAHPPHPSPSDRSSRQSDQPKKNAGLGKKSDLPQPKSPRRSASGLEELVWKGCHGKGEDESLGAAITQPWPMLLWKSFRWLNLPLNQRTSGARILPPRPWSVLDLMFCSASKPSTSTRRGEVWMAAPARLPRSLPQPVRTRKRRVTNPLATGLPPAVTEANRKPTPYQPALRPGRRLYPMLSSIASSTELSCHPARLGPVSQGRLEEVIREALNPRRRKVFSQTSSRSRRTDPPAAGVSLIHGLAGARQGGFDRLKGSLMECHPHESLK